MSTESSGDEGRGEDPPPIGPQDFAAVDDWPGYFGAVLGKPPLDTLLTALSAFEREGVSAGFAVDLAAGGAGIEKMTGFLSCL